MNRKLLVTTLLLGLAACGTLEETRQLIPGDLSGRHPSWSPDGHHLAFESDRGGNWDLYLLDIESGEVTAITRSPASDRYPAWSPEGDRLVFVSDRQGEPDLYLLEIATGKVFRIASIAGEELFPAWSPTGREIAFTLNDGGTFRLMTILLEEPSPQPLLPRAGRDLWPRWSPDGERIAFFSRRDTAGEDDEIHVLERPTGNLTRITHRLGHDFCPAWSPNGDRLVFVRVEPDGTRALSVADAWSGHEIARLAAGYHRVTEPAWSPDGRWVAFAARRSPEEGYRLRVEPVRFDSRKLP